MQRFLQLSLFCLSLFLGLGTAGAHAADYHQVNNGQTSVIDEHTVCRVVTNNSGAAIYVPTKTSAEWAAFYNNPPDNVATPPCAGCSLDGANVAHGDSRTFYLSTRSCYGTCGSISQSRNCYNGSLDGSSSYSKANCPSPTCSGCTTSGVNWTTTSFTCSASATAGSHTTTRNVSDGAAPNVGSASFQCDDGTWVQSSGSCGGASCSLPWGGSINHSQSVTAYQTSSVTCGNTCASQLRTCNNGSLSGTYGNAGCSVDACASCSLPWGGSIAHNQSVTAYQSSSVPCGSSCNNQTRTCNNGSLSGSYTNSSCSVASCGCTLPWGGTIASGQSVTAYQTSSVACGSSCNSQTRTCSGTTLSGSYTNQNCSVGACAGCTAPNGASMTHGSCIKKYSRSTTDRCGGYCETCNMISMNFCCNNGTVSNTAQWSYYNSTTCSETCSAGLECY